ncbi:MAG: T9SS type A sorting domain-containing protein [Muribaculaceae bacterium]|nr:T9SS type A sorting domain-containing protein [Muribaculaceae bacterium]
MKRIFTLFTIILAFHILNAQESYRFRTDAPQGFNIENSTASGLSLRYALNEITIADYHNGDDKGQEIIMKGSFGSFAEGLPNLPFENRYIAVPSGAKVSVKVKENGCQILNDIDLLPAAEVILNRAAELPKLHKDMSVFGKDANFPVENVTIGRATQIRGLDVVMLSVTPFRYNPVRKTLDIIYDMDIKISFEGGNGQFGDTRYHNPAWDGILRDLVINSDMLPEAHYYERLSEVIQNREEGCEYLIITPDDSAFIAWADTLKQFRTKQGILTKVATTADCGGNEPEDIRNYILNAYENWAIPPAAVLLFGGNHTTQSDFGLKPFIYISPVSWGETYRYPTDNPFADMNGDSIPDLAISRMTALNANECRIQVEKLLEYELTPPTDAHYYDHPIINSGYQDSKWFAITAQVTHNFLRDKLGKHPANIYMKYWYEDYDLTPPDSIWSIAPNTDAVLDYFGPNGAQYIPSSIGGLDNWIDMEDKLPFQNAVKEGSFMTFYRDHSNPKWWCCSNIRHEDVPSFQNKRPTFMFAIGCSTNNFWNDWSYEGCITDLFLNADVGTIGSIGANSVTYSHYNDLVTWGMFDYIWPDFMPTLESQTEPDFAYPSYSLVAGKLFLSRQTFLPYSMDTEKVDKTLNLFSYLGETYLCLYTELPQQMQADVPLYQPQGPWAYSFTVEEGATVCFTKDGEILQVMQSTGQAQSVMLPSLEVGEQFTVTATKHNRFRHEQTVKIISAESPFTYLKSTVLKDQDGNGQLDYGEYISFDINLGNAGRLASEGGQVTLLCESPYVTLLQDAESYPRVEPESSITLDNVFKIQIAKDVPDQTFIRFGLRFNDDENTHTDYFEYLAHAPVFQIESEFSITDIDGNPSTHILTEGVSLLSFTVKNDGSSKSQAVNAQVEIKAPFLTVEEPQLLSNGIEPNGSLRLTFPIKADGTEDLGAWPQVQLKFQHGDTEIQIDTIVQYGGLFENFETDTLNPLFNWTNSSSHRWKYCDDDAFEGQRSFQCSIQDNYYSYLDCQSKNGNLVKHASKTSFRYKSNKSGILHYTINDNSSTAKTLDKSDEWKYAEVRFPIRHSWINWELFASYPLGDTLIAKLDDICFPPKHRPILNAGNDLVSCGGNAVELRNAYAYDCNSAYWVTEGDGDFEDYTMVNTMYTPGSQDLENGEVTLSLYAIGNDTLVSSMHIRFVDQISLDQIIGDSVVNKFSNLISHYAVERQDGIRYLWQLEPAHAGNIYGSGNEIDILWNQNEDDTEVTLSVTADSGCEVDPVSKTISLIGYSTPEWHSVDFDLFPNPTDGKVNLIVGEMLHGKAVVEVYNLLGEQMMNKSIGRLMKGDAVSLDLSHLVSGLYIIKLNTENGSCSKKVSVR